MSALRAGRRHRAHCYRKLIHPLRTGCELGRDNLIHIQGVLSSLSLSISLSLSLSCELTKRSRGPLIQSGPWAIPDASGVESVSPAVRSHRESLQPPGAETMPPRTHLWEGRPGQALTLGKGVLVGFQPSFARALAGLPSSRSTWRGGEGGRHAEQAISLAMARHTRRPSRRADH